MEESSMENRTKGGILEAERCLQCYDAPCAKGCPAGVDVKRFIGYVKHGEYYQAASAIESENPFGLICGYICPSQTSCQKNCTHNTLGRPIDIKALQACAIQTSRGMFGVPPQPPAPTDGGYRINSGGFVVSRQAVRCGGRAAVIGGGPAGITAAYYLTMFGCDTHIFEKTASLGGKLYGEIPGFRVDRELVAAEIKRLTKGVTVHLGCPAETVTPARLLAAGFDAVFIGAGKSLPQKLNIEGEQLEGVYSADDVLLSDSWRAAGHRKAVVIGAGNSAMDAARTLKRAGLENVQILYRGGNLRVKAIQEEREAAYLEDISLTTYAVPKMIIGVNGRASAVCFRRSEPSKQGGAGGVAETDPRFDFIIEADMVVAALGHRLDPDVSALLGFPDAGGGGVAVDENGATRIEGVFAGGDLTGGASVAQAVGSAKNAAISMAEFINSKRSRR